jgi:glycine oxidase
MSLAPLLIVGQGLAGTALAWQLWARRQPFLVIDREDPVTSSKIAAGLLTPITGMRMSLNPDYAAHWVEAVKFYRSKQRHLGSRFLHARTQVRLFKNDEEPLRWGKRRSQPAVQRFIKSNEPALDPGQLTNQRGGYEMQHSGYLDTASYLTASRAFFRSIGGYQATVLDHSDLKVQNDSIQWLGDHYSSVVFCTGWEAMRHPWFEWVPFQPARGIILTLSTPLTEQRIVNCGCWLVPQDRDTVRAGATYETDFVDPHGIDVIKLAALRGKLDLLLRLPYDIIDQQAAVRPIIQGQRTLIGRHPARPAVAFFNGLGSKGVLRSPHYARLLANHLLNGDPIPTNCDLQANL